MNELTKPKLPPGQQLVAPGKWPVIGERNPCQSDAPWTLSVTGKVDTPRTFSLAELSGFKQTTITLDIHCVTRWSMLNVEVAGVLLGDILNEVGARTDAQFVSFASRSDRKHSSSMALSAALELGTILATHVNAEPLSSEHGGPIRNIVPGRYFYKSVKWLERIDLLVTDQLGYWEAESGYHNNADPWAEERYMAPSIDKRTAAFLIISRDFSGRDLRSINCSRRDLTGLNARAALLRDGDFRDAILIGADFCQANLSNAHFERADLTGANFNGADLEGANFTGANLSAANLSNASLFGVTFGDARLSAAIDNETIMPAEILEPLTPDQMAIVMSMREKCRAR